MKIRRQGSQKRTGGPAPILDGVMLTVINGSARSKIIGINYLSMQDPFIRDFFEIPGRQREHRPHSLGSGTTFDRNSGFVLTNNHVVGTDPNRMSP